MSDKRDEYFQGAPLVGHEEPLPLHDGLQPQVKRRLRLLATAVGLFGGGLLIGLFLAPDSPRATQARLVALQTTLGQREAQLATLQQASSTSHGTGERGRLRPADRTRHEREGRRYAQSLRKTGAQAAGDLMEWFVGRWNQLLDYPQEDDRVSRRAATLALLVGGMAANVNPGDYVPWQAEFLGGNWLGELHFDADGDRRPGKRGDPNPHDGFANVSVCQVAMALNQLARDAQVLMMPEMRCDRPEARMSVFLQGKTVDDALTEFVRAIKEQGFLVVERMDKEMRLVLVGIRPQKRDDE